MAAASPERHHTVNNGRTASPEKPSAAGNGHPSQPVLANVDGELRWLRRCVEVAAKGFVIGSGLKGGLALFSVLVRLRSRRSPRSRKAGGMTNEEAVVMAMKETMRYGMFLGSFADSFVSADECIAAIWGRKRTARWRSLLAGLIAGPSMLLTGPNTQHTSFGNIHSYACCCTCIPCGIKSKRFGKLCKPLT